MRAANLSKYEALYYKKLGGGVVQCRLCPNRCTLGNLARGLCGDRINLDGKLYSLVYGKPVAVHLDPIEKKPLSHFLPGTTAFSIATAGCNLGCVFCQNWQISQAKPEEAEHENYPPEKVVALALAAGSPTIAYTYTEPAVFYEYMLATAKLAKRKGLRNIMHSCGYINPEPLKALLKYMDACNIDLKGFSEEYYQKMSNGHLLPVLETLKTIKKAGVWLEITNLVVPGKNDDPAMIRRMARWIRDNLGPDTPLYFAAFHPEYRLQNLPPTPVETLEQAYKIARAEGLNYVYIGNVFGHTSGDTYCPDCDKLLIKRSGYSVEVNNVVAGKCRFCGRPIAGVWE
ncbi:MAG: AmmeMemoRadiSam system radical SAM enzyme [Candidatus Saganbacteria bacterium]|nr:AmmeMemoRadiSam system radical SAM enzyme [Candidatus Saganbacteria bacterium]